MIYEFNSKRPKIDENAFIDESAVIIGDVTIAAHCYVGPGAVIRADAKPIIIGYGTAVEDGVLIHAGGPGCEASVIGEKVTIGHGAIVHSNLIADGANIGMGAVLSLYSEIGEYAVVAEGAVVKQGQKIPPRVVVGGAPAKVLRELEQRDIDAWDYAKRMYIEHAIIYNTPGKLVRID